MANIFDILLGDCGPSYSRKLLMERLASGDLPKRFSGQTSARGESSRHPFIKIHAQNMGLFHLPLVIQEWSVSSSGVVSIAGLFEGGYTHRLLASAPVGHEILLSAWKDKPSEKPDHLGTFATKISQYVVTSAYSECRAFTLTLDVVGDAIDCESKGLYRGPLSGAIIGAEREALSWGRAAGRSTHWLKTMIEAMPDDGLGVCWNGYGVQSAAAFAKAFVASGVVQGCKFDRSSMTLTGDDKTVLFVTDDEQLRGPRFDAVMVSCATGSKIMGTGDGSLVSYYPFIIKNDDTPLFLDLNFRLP